MADDAAVKKASAAIKAATSQDDLKRFTTVVDQRQHDGIYSAEQAALLLDLLNQQSNKLRYAEAQA